MEADTTNSIAHDVMDTCSGNTVAMREVARAICGLADADDDRVLSEILERANARV